MIDATSELVTLKKFPTLEEANRAAGLEAEIQVLSPFQSLHSTKANEPLPQAPCR
jgi:hypothetical protein